MNTVEYTTSLFKFTTYIQLMQWHKPLKDIISRVVDSVCTYRTASALDSFRLPSISEGKLSGGMIRTLTSLQTNKAQILRDNFSWKQSSMLSMYEREMSNRNSCTYVARSSNFSSTAGALKLRIKSKYSNTSRFRRIPPLQKSSARKSLRLYESN